MLTNDQMKSGRFLRWHLARRRIAWAKGELAKGSAIYILTYTRATKLTAKHADMIKATRSGCYMQRGRQWVCIDGCGLANSGRQYCPVPDYATACRSDYRPWHGHSVPIAA